MVRAFLYQNLTKTGAHNVRESKNKRIKQKKTDKQTLLYHMLLGDVN